MSKTLICNARLAGEAVADAWVLVDDERIAAVGHSLPMPLADECIDAAGALLMPGVIDCHVHFREPGLTAKADIASESRAAVAGGVTSYIDMPNTKPATTTIEAWRQKCLLAQEKSEANYAFFIGATNDNVDELKKADYAQVPGVKLFMGSSTGNMLVDSEEAISRLFSEVDAIVAVHAEDQAEIDNNVKAAKAACGDDVPVAMHSVIRSEEACLKCTQRAVHLALQSKHRLHVCHISTACEVDLIAKTEADKPLKDKLVTAEVSPHHLLWCDADYDKKGTRIKMNPAVKTAADRNALRKALIDGRIDMVATDHAPHLLSEKEGNALTATSGAPMVQFSLVAMLSIFDEALVQRVMCHNPAEIFGICGRGTIAVGNYADLALVREVEPYAISDADVVSKCGWTPMDGVEVRHRVEMTWVNGHRAYPFADSRHPLPLNFKNN